MARAIKHIKAGLLHIEVIGTVPEASPGRRRLKRLLDVTEEAGS